ncbi:LOW QUALITY PROTEIN: hypothetical protein HID58_081589, partial [Brassica napus]
PFLLCTKNQPFLLSPFSFVFLFSVYYITRIFMARRRSGGRRFLGFLDARWARAATRSKTIYAMNWSVRCDKNFGHQDEILAIDALRKERALTLGRDRTMLLHKMSETSRTIYRAPASSLESCCFISETEYLSGSDRNALLKKKPVFLLKNAHSVVAGVITTNENGDHDCVEYSNSSTTSSWVSSAAVGSDFAVSGAGNGFVHLMVVEASALWIFIQASTDKTGFVNSMAFAKSGKFLIAGVGQNCYGFCDINMLQETRFGRWGCIKSAQNGVAIHPLRLS